MGLLETIKETVSVIQKADNLDLYRQILEIQRQALDLVEEVRKLKEENQELRDKLQRKGRIIRHKQPVVTLEGDNTVFCAACYGKDDKLIQMKLVDDHYWCPVCHLNHIRLPID